jgi:hypothetical protein
MKSIPCVDLLAVDFAGSNSNFGIEYRNYTKLARCLPHAKKGREGTILGAAFERVIASEH